MIARRSAGTSFHGPRVPTDWADIAGTDRIVPDVTASSLAPVDADPDLDFLRSSAPPATPADPDPIPIVDLFSGCGGLTIGAIEGARRMGRRAELMLAVDLAPEPLAVLRATYGIDESCTRRLDLSVVLGALSEPIRLSERELFGPVPEGCILVAGPPCQGHSTLNNHTRHDDPRNDLYLAVARAARLLQPRAVIIENVSGVGRDRRRAAARCAAALEEMGYEVTARRVNLHEWGVPQTRIRHVLVALRGRRFTWDAVAQAPLRDVRWAISDLLDIEPEGVWDIASTPSPENRERIAWLFRNGKHDLPNELRPPCHRGHHSYVSMYGRLYWDRPAQTVTTGFQSMGQGRFVHPARPRTLTPHEAARLQFLPDFVQWSEGGSRSALARMIGNAAPPALTMRIIQAILREEAGDAAAAPPDLRIGTPLEEKENGLAARG